MLGEFAGGGGCGVALRPAMMSGVGVSLPSSGDGLSACDEEACGS